MIELHEIKEAFLAINARPVAYFPAYVKITGRLTAGVLLSQLMYLFRAFNGSEFYRTDATLIDETGLTDAELSGAKKILKEKRLCQIKAKGIPAVTHYLPDVEAIVKAVSSLQEIANTVSVNSGNLSDEFAEQIILNNKTIEIDIHSAPQILSKRMLSSVLYKEQAMMSLPPEKRTEALDTLSDFCAWYLQKNYPTMTNEELLRLAAARLNVGLLWSTWSRSWLPNILQSKHPHGKPKPKTGKSDQDYVQSAVESARILGL